MKRANFVHHKANESIKYEAAESMGAGLKEDR